MDRDFSAVTSRMDRLVMAMWAMSSMICASNIAIFTVLATRGA